MFQRKRRTSHASFVLLFMWCVQCLLILSLERPKLLQMVKNNWFFIFFFKPVMSVIRSASGWRAKSLLKPGCWLSPLLGAQVRSAPWTWHSTLYNGCRRVVAWCLSSTQWLWQVLGHTGHQDESGSKAEVVGEASDIAKVLVIISTRHRLSLSFPPSLYLSISLCVSGITWSARLFPAA